MGSPTDDLNAYAQRIYLRIKNRYFDEITGTDGAVYVSQVIDNTNMFLDELEQEVGPDGKVVDWWFARENEAALGSATEGETILAMPRGVERLITDEHRYVRITNSDGTVVSSWAVVAAKHISNQSGRSNEDRCAMVGTDIMFSRAFRDTENGGTVTGDVMNTIPRLSSTNVKALTLVKPQSLLILGVAKNTTLPDIVQGKLSPSYVQRFNDLLTGAIARSGASSRSADAERQDYSGVGGVY